jgi:hypothetical protein
MKENNKYIELEIYRLSVRIAFARYELNEAICNGTPLGLCRKQCEEIHLCTSQRSALRDGCFDKLPYNIKSFYIV